MNLSKKILLFAVLSLFTYLSKAQGEKWSSHPDTAIFNSYTSYQISIDHITAIAPGKFILVFYYEHFSIRVNNFNKWVMADTAVVNFVKANFYPICIDLDIDKLGPSKPDIKRSKTYREFLKDQAYYVSATPALSIYNPAGELKGTKTFLNAKKETATEIVTAILDWMRKRLIH